MRRREFIRLVGGLATIPLRAQQVMPVVGYLIARLGLVANLNWPGGNVTGATNLIVEVAPKRLELLHELLPTASVMALFVNPADCALAQAQARELLA